MIIIIIIICSRTASGTPAPRSHGEVPKGKPQPGSSVSTLAHLLLDKKR